MNLAANYACAPRADLVQAGLVTCGDITGHEQIEVELRAGDTVHWKRNGQRGHLTCRVLGFSGDKLHMQPIDPSSGAANGRAVAAFRRVARAWRAGVLVGMPGPFRSTVLSYEFDPAKNWGEITVAWPGHREVFANNRGPGWPVRALKAGDEVLVTAKQIPGESYATFFIV